MATGGGTADHLHCPVCLEYYKGRNPRLLSCHHSFCEGCLKELVKYGQISCPKCREMTTVKDGDVTNLTMNFHILPQLEESQNFEKKCQLCNISVAILKCEECNQVLCQECSGSHSKVKRFKDHIVFKLCVKHAESLSQICIKCVKPVCFKCLILEHQEHEDLVVAYKIGVTELRQKITIMTENVNEKLERVHEIIKEDEVQLTYMKHLMNKYESLQHEYLEKAEEAGRKRKEIETCFNKNGKVRLKQTAAVCNAEILVSDLKLFNYQNDDHMFKHFSELKRRVASEIDKNPDNLIRMLSPNMPMDIKHKLLDKAEQVALINSESLGMQVLVSGTTMWDQSLIVADAKANFVRHIDRKGNILEEFQLEQEFGPVKDVEIHGNSLYIAQEKCIKEIVDVAQDTRKVRKFIIEMGKISKICVVSHTQILYTDFYKGKIYQYNPMEQTVHMVLQGLKYPSYVNTITNESRIKYIVSFRNDHLLQVYNSQWQYLVTIGKGTKGTGDGYLWMPQGSVCTEEGILVADSGNNRVCLFNFTGEFVREYLTAVDGMKHAISLVFRPPLLWVICQKRVVCFKVHDK